jgi:hypothetical protein
MTLVAFMQASRVTREAVLRSRQAQRRLAAARAESVLAQRLRALWDATHYGAIWKSLLAKLGVLCIIGLCIALFFLPAIVGALTLSLYVEDAHVFYYCDNPAYVRDLLLASSSQLFVVQLYVILWGAGDYMLDPANAALVQRLGSVVRVLRLLPWLACVGTAGKCDVVTWALLVNQCLCELLHGHCW